MRKIFLSIAFITAAVAGYTQVVYNNSFDNLSLQTYTTASSLTKFSVVPPSFSGITDGLKNNTGSTANPNRPYHATGMQNTGWAVVYNAAENDTFLVCTSWLDTTGISVDRWTITPAISNITANTVLTWLAKSPDASYADGYEVYGTATTGVLTQQSFAAGDRLFALADANTSGGGEKNTWTRRSVNVGAFAGQTMRFAFRNNSRDMYQLWIDDIQVINLSKSIDGALSSITPKKYVLVNSSDSVKFNVSNLGASTINTINVSYQIGNSSVNTENIIFTGGLSYGQVAATKFALPYSISTAGYYQVRSWINSVNGQTDQYLLNDTLTDGLTVQFNSPGKTVLLEQFVSANDGESPNTQEKTLALQSSTLIVVNIHDMDSLKENNSAALINDFKTNGPGAMVDRIYYPDLQSTIIPLQSYNSRINARKNAVTPVSLGVINKSYNTTTKELVFTLKADFAGSVKGDYRLNAYLTENYVSGPVTDTTINGYNQLNNYFGVSWSGYYQQGYYSPLADSYVLNYWQYQHHNTLVHAFDGAYGNNSTIPSSVTQGQSFQQTFSLTVNTPTNGIHKFNPDNLYIVGFAAEYSSDKNKRNVLNSVKEKLTASPEAAGIVRNRDSYNKLLLYPNPSRGLFYFNTAIEPGTYEMGVFDIYGKCVKNLEVSNSNVIQPIDLSELVAGVYILKFSSARHQFTEKVIIQK